MSNYLPEDILIEIFIRLPWKSLMRLRCVSKSVCALIRSQSFISSHYYFSNTKNNISILTSENVCKRIFSSDYNSISSLFPLSTSSSTSTELECDQYITDWMDYPSLSQNCDIEFLGSCNGLLCICCSRYGHDTCSSSDNELCFHHDSGSCCHGQEIHLWNPSTNQYKKLPTVPQRPSEYVDVDTYGFGYDYKFDDYKLVRFIDDEDDDIFDLDVYSLKSNSWKTIPNIPYSARKDCYHGGVLVNGALHWFASTKGQDSEVLISFDIVNERFEEVALPEGPIPNLKESLEDDFCTCDLNVAVLGGCLCLLFHVFDVRADVWVMQEYGVKESWTKSFSITHEAIIRNSYLMLVWSFKNNEILVQAGWSICLYDPNSKTYKELKVLGFGERLVADKYMAASIISLNKGKNKPYWGDTFMQWLLKPYNGLFQPFGSKLLAYCS